MTGSNLAVGQTEKRVGTKAQAIAIENFIPKMTFHMQALLCDAQRDNRVERRRMSVELNQVVGSIKKSGFAVIDNYCDDELLSALCEEAGALARSKPNFIKDHSMTHGNSFLLNMVPARVQGDRDGAEQTAYIRGLFGNSNIEKLASQYLGGGGGVSNYIYHRACAEQHETQELFPLHYDNFQNCYCLKGFLYLEYCNISNGALRFVPGTHRLVRKFLKINRRASSSTQENKLEAMLDVIGQNGMSSYSRTEQELIEKLREISAEPAKSLEYAIERKAGSLVLFDTIGIHGGVSVARGERWIARFHLVDRKYRFWNHPEQEGIIMGLISRICRKARRLGK